MCMRGTHCELLEYEFFTISNLYAIHWTYTARSFECVLLSNFIVFEGFQTALIMYQWALTTPNSVFACSQNARDSETTEIDAQIHPTTELPSPLEEEKRTRTVNNCITAHITLIITELFLFSSFLRDLTKAIGGVCT
jgi:hypothetical protein